MSHRPASCYLMIAYNTILGASVIRERSFELTDRGLCDRPLLRVQPSFLQVHDS